MRGCAFFGYLRHDFDNILIDNGMDRGYMNCHDFIHPGMRTIAMGTQLIINHICNN